MKRILIPFSLILLTLTFTFSSCVQGDIDDLQSQIDDLDNKVTELEGSQQEALLAEIAKLEASLTELNGSYDSVLEDLTNLEEEIANNSDAVYYGNVVTDADYAAYTAQGATIISGKVIVNSTANVQALSNVKLIGMDLIINDGSNVSLPNLEAVSGGLIITELNDETGVEFPKMVSVGNQISINNNPGLQSLTSNALVHIGGGVNVVDNEDILTSISFEALDYVGGDLSIDNMSATTYDKGMLTTTVLSNADIKGDVNVFGVGGGSINLGSVEGNLQVVESNIVSLEMTGAEVGLLYIESCAYLTDVSFDNLTTINQDLKLISNKAQGGFGIGSNELKSESAHFNVDAFDALTYVDGKVYISANDFGEEFIGFNNVKMVGGIKYTTEYTDVDIRLENNIDALRTEVFNGLVTEFGNEIRTSTSINIRGNVAWFNSFQSLTQASEIQIELTRIMDEMTGDWSSDLRIDGFDALTEASTLKIYCFSMTEFNAFPVLENLNAYQEDYFYVEMPHYRDNMTWEYSVADVDMCSLSMMFNKILTDENYNNDWVSQPSFMDMINGGSLEKADAIATLTDGCSN